MANDLNLLDDDDDDMPTAPFWMSTFSDMATLLLTFFVLIVAMSEVEVKRFKEALSYFQGRPSLLTHDAVMPPQRRQEITTFKSRKQAEQYERLIQELAAAGLHNKVQVDLTEAGLHVMITDSVMFRSGQAELIDPSRAILRLVAGVFDKSGLYVFVEGHTDDRPIATSAFPSNWELSAARASAVVRFLLEQPTALPPAHYSAAGYGEFHPIDTNDTPDGRARNRRVEILFTSEPWQSEIHPSPIQQTLTPTL